MPRKVCWFSCGAPSAVAAKLSLLSDPNCEVVYTQVVEEHEDNLRFLKDVETWLQHEVKIIGNDNYGRSIYEVFRKTQYLVGIQGAPCTRLLKRKVREEFQLPDDIHVLGFTKEEEHRLDDFREHFPELTVECPLIDMGLLKSDCLAMIQHAGIELPVMYKLGYNNNNCIGCVKGGMGYWNKIRRDFPERFEKMAKTEREIGHSIIRRGGKPLYLDELPEDAGRDIPEPNIECSILCLNAINEYTN
jgi:hypothetical protein